MNRRFTVAIASVLLALITCRGFEEDEVLCEEAVAHLDGCCPNFPPQSLQCVHTTTCFGSDLPTDLSSSISECITSRTCEEIVSDGMCALKVRSSTVGQGLFPSQARTVINGGPCG